MKAERPARLLLPPLETAPRLSVVSSGRRSAPPPAEDGVSAKLFEALRAHRMQLARAQGVPPYVVASDRTLRELAALRPRTAGELLQVYGIGAAKAERYGRGFLEVIASAAR
jgi:ATP-dependent DNA helicase RecQ